MRSESDFGYGIATTDLEMRPEAVARLVKKYGPADLRAEMENYDGGETGFVENYEDEDGVSGCFGVIVRILNSRKYRGFRWEEDFLYYPVCLPANALERSVFPTEADIESEILLLVNPDTTNSPSKRSFFYDRICL